MKILLVLLLTFSIFIDFSSSSHEVEESVSSCDSYSICQDSDFHDTKAGHTSSDDCDHCHCHAGHVHTAILKQTITSLNRLSRENYTQFSTDSIFTISDYNSEIIRPPIA